MHAKSGSRFVMFFVAGILLASVCLTSCKGKRSGNEVVTIAQWGQERYLIYLPLYVAIEEGYFQKRGIETRVTFTGNDDQTFAAVMSGSAQFGVGDPVFTAISEEHGYPAKVVANIVSGVAIWGLTNNPSIQYIKSPNQLAGLRIGTFPSPSTNYTLMRDLISRTPELKDTTIIQAPIGSQLALLNSHRADVAMELEPSTSIAEAQGYRVVYSSPQFHGPFAFTGLTTTDRMIKDSPETVAKVVDALEEAETRCHEDPQLAIRVASKLFPTLSNEIVTRAVNRMLNEGTLPQHTAVTEQAWQAALKVRLEVGDLSKPQETSQSVDNSFADRAMAHFARK